MAPEERNALEHRAASLRPWLAPYVQPDESDMVAEVISDMLQGYPALKGDTSPAAIARIDGMMRAVEIFPSWAIQQACASISRRGYQVQDKDGDWKTERHWPPSSADVCKVVEEMVAGRRMVLAQAEALLDAPVEEQEAPTADAKAAQVADWQAKWNAKTAVTAATLEATVAEISGRRAAEVQERQMRRIVDEYRSKGLEPPAFKGIPVSLSMLLRLGWTIQEDGEGKKVLVRPPKEPTGKRATKIGEMGR